MIKLAEKLLEAVGIALAGSMVALLFFQVCSRYLAGYSPVWASEIAQAQFVWVCFIGFAIALGRGQHVSLEYLLERLPPGARRALAILSEAAMLAFAVTMAHGGVVLVDRLKDSVTSGLGISVAWIYAAPVTAGAAMTLLSAMRLIALVRREPDAACP